LLRWRWLIVGGVALGGCAHYQAAPLPPERSAQEFAARSLPAAREWDRAGLLSLALKQNPGLAVAHAEIQAAMAHEITAAELPNPDLTLQSEYARHDPHPWLYGISLNWLLRSGERRRLDTEIARLDTSNARLQLMDHAWSVRRALAAALSDWESARQRASLLERLAAAQDRLIELEQRRIKAGEDAPSELILIQQARIQIEQQVAELRTAANASQAAIARALGVPSQALDGLRFEWLDWGEPPAVEDAKRQQLREQALLSRADLGVAIGEYAAAEAKLRLAIAHQYPQFTLSPGYYWDHGIAKFPFDVGFTLPLNGNRGEIAEARAGRELAGQRLLALQADIYGEIEAAEREERIARQSADAAQRRLVSAQRQVQQADLALRLGAADAQEQLGAQILAAQAELEVLQTRAQLQVSRNNLEDVLRAPLSGPELALAGS
ncbi:MAG: outer membrane protein heavy metal efflux system, partial [Gammaproteobacteria bacterium]|jgi:cobalt-zinc-cadmium efflux system outer membrane protein|nr:outer membrane protein heavy metal efflux system [Gammaproteobacteria bacterium]